MLASSNTKAPSNSTEVNAALLAATSSALNGLFRFHSGNLAGSTVNTTSKLIAWPAGTVIDAGKSQLIAAVSISLW